MPGIDSFLNQFKLISHIPVFSDLNWFDLQKIVHKSIISEYKKGDIVSKQGNPPDYFYCLISGRLKAYLETDKGIQVVDHIHRGKYFGIISTLTGENHSMTFEALNDSVILKVDKEDFKDLIRKIPKLSMIFSKSLSKRMRRNIHGLNNAFESNIISIYSPVQGTGSSTYAFNMALSLRKETSKKVLLVSMSREHEPDDEGSPDKEYRKLINFKDIASDDKKVYEHIIRDDLPIDVLNIFVGSDEEDLKKHISPFVSSLVGDYHYVIVDLPNSMDDVVSETLMQSDQVHLICFDRRADMKLLKGVIDSLKISLQDNFKVKNIKVILRTIRSQTYFSFESYNEFLGYDVYTMLPAISDNDIEVDESSTSSLFLKAKDKSEYAIAVRKIAREVGEVLVGIALGGGAALGLCHLGVIKVLEEEGIPIDVISGSSMGSVIGSLWSIGKSYKELEEIASEFKDKRSLTKLIDPVLPISGIIRGRNIMKWLKKHLGDRTFYSAKIPLKVVAYDLNTRRDIVHNSGLIVDAIRQSIAIPGVLTPIKKDGKLIIDGGVMNPLPTDVLAGLGIKKIISVNVLQSPDDVVKSYKREQEKRYEIEKKPFLKFPLTFMWFRIGRFFERIFKPSITDIIVLTLQSAEYVIAEQSEKQADVAIHPDLSGFNWYELFRVDELIKTGEEAARRNLPAIKKLVEESIHN